MGHSLQLSAAIASLALLLLPGLYNPLTTPSGAADPLYSAVLAWAFFGVHKELSKAPLQGDLATWCPLLVADALSNVAALMSVLLLAVVLGRVALGALRPLQAESTRSPEKMRVYPPYTEHSVAK